jgi:16S rRNA (cytosine967-C5)-methyltransferase
LAHTDGDVLDILRTAAYQIFLLDRVPSHAAVDAAVEAARRIRGPEVGGFVNAVLRHLRAQDWDAVLPAAGAERLAVACSLPDALAARLEARLGPAEAGALGAALLERAALTIRANVRKTSVLALSERLRAEGATVAPGRWAAQALRVGELHTPFTSPSYLEGWWTAQDEAAQLVSELVDPQRGEVVLDACAGVGGKATHLAALIGDEGQVIAADVSARKLQLLEEHCRRLGVACVARQVDVTAAGALEGLRADRAMVDAPCSGWGVLRRHPELKWRADEPALAQLVALQRELLRSVLAALRPGGVLVYSVCTFTEEEGPAQARWLRRTFPELEPWPAERGPLAQLWEEASSDDGLTLWPHRHGTDGFFVARFRKR